MWGRLEEVGSYGLSLAILRTPVPLMAVRGESSHSSLSLFIQTNLMSPLPGKTAVSMAGMGLILSPGNGLVRLTVFHTCLRTFGFKGEGSHF